MSRSLRRLVACLVGVGFLAVRYQVTDERIACGFPLPFCHLKNGYMWGGGQAMVIAPLDFLVGFGVGWFILWGVSDLFGKPKGPATHDSDQEHATDADPSSA